MYCKNINIFTSTVLCLLLYLSFQFFMILIIYCNLSGEPCQISAREVVQFEREEQSDEGNKKLVERNRFREWGIAESHCLRFHVRSVGGKHRKCFTFWFFTFCYSKVQCYFLILYFLLFWSSKILSDSLLFVILKFNDTLWFFFFPLLVLYKVTCLMKLGL